MVTASPEAAAATAGTAPASTNGNKNNGGGGGGANGGDGREPLKKRLKSLQEEGGSAPPQQPAATTEESCKTDDVLLSELVTPSILEDESVWKERYGGNRPYPHCVLPNLFAADFLREVREEIKDNSKVNFKESDLFKMYQSIDLANLTEQQHGKDMPAVMKLRKALYSDQWRHFIERVAGLDEGTLSSQVDCACNCHSASCHLLCHDDVIKTRKISYILYLTDDEPTAWQSSEGGALELYDSSASKNPGATTEQQSEKQRQRVPDSIPCKTALPLFNHMAFFRVQPGISFHSVQEVVGDRPRLSLQGWYHADKEPENIHHATLQRLKAKKKKAEDDESADYNEGDEAFQKYPEEKHNKGAKADTDADVLSEEDIKYLSNYLDPTYLKPEALKEMKECFEEESSIQLRHFLNDKWLGLINRAVAEEDQTQLDIDDPNFYKQGVSDEWRLVGPSHMQRFLQYDETDKKKPAEPKTAGEFLQHFRTEVMQSLPFRRFLKIVTSLGEPLGYNGLVRRFRPGRDYTVAHYGLLKDRAVLDATLCFAAGTGILPTTADVEGEDEAEEQQEDRAKGAATTKEVKAVATDSQEQIVPDEADLAWLSGDVGGFECYIAADDEGGGPGGNAKTPDESYNQDDDTELLSVSASNNTLSLVYRDTGVMRFVKYVSKMAPSSRWDVTMEYEVDDNDDDREQGQQGDDTAIGF